MKRTPVWRRAELPRRTGPLHRRHRADPVWWSVRVAVWGRARGDCERCGARLGVLWEAHHRKLRSQGGEHAVCNAVALCRACHRQAHSRRHDAELTGFIVPALLDPAVVPVLLHDGRRVLLAADGSYCHAPWAAAT